MTETAIAEKIGKSQGYVDKRINIRILNPEPRGRPTESYALDPNNLSVALNFLFLYLFYDIVCKIYNFYLYTKR